MRTVPGSELCYPKFMLVSISKQGLFIGLAGMLVACANGSDVSDQEFNGTFSDGGEGSAGVAGSGSEGGSGGSGQAQGGTGGSAGTGGTPTAGTGGKDDAGIGGTGGIGETGGIGGTGGTGETGGSNATGGTAGSTVVDCDFPHECVDAIDVGTVSGDTGSDVIEVQGATSTWLKVRVLEKNESLVGHKLKLKASLRPGNATNFDLYLFLNENSDVLECTHLVASSLKTLNQLDTASVSFGEGSVPNGNLDHRWVTIEIRRVIGTCDTANPWTLKLEGNK